MQLDLYLIYTTAESGKSGAQIVRTIMAAIVEPMAAEPPFENIERLTISLALTHPLAGDGRPVPARARYHTPTGTVFANASINYADWIEERWSSRVDAAKDAICAAVGAVAKSRLTVTERTRATTLVHDAIETVKSSPPSDLVPLESVSLVSYEGVERPSISFGDHSSAFQLPGTTVKELPPSELLAYLRDTPPIPTPAPPMFKLYAQRDGRLNYYEAWAADGAVVEHWGVCGERGEIRNLPTEERDTAARLDRLKRGGRAKGFATIPLSRHANLLVERSIDGFGRPDQLERRHELEAFLNDKLGWLGLGHCDGGSTGSGSMEAHCLVVDGPRALEAMRRELAQSPFSDFHVRLSRDGA